MQPPGREPVCQKPSIKKLNPFLMRPDPVTGEGPTVPAVPPKFPLPETASPGSWVSGLRSIVLYIGFGYLLLRRWDLLLVIFGVLLLHEAGHFIAMKYYRYADVKMLFLPFIGALVKGAKQEISQRQSIVILLAGPLPGLLLGIVVYFLDKNHNG